MSEIVVVGSFTAQPGKEAEAVEAFEALVEPTHREEGCILYALHQGIDDDLARGVSSGLDESQAELRGLCGWVVAA